MYIQKQKAPKPNGQINPNLYFICTGILYFNTRLVGIRIATLYFNTRLVGIRIATLLYARRNYQLKYRISPSKVRILYIGIGIV